jgi:hypothetical protein
MRHLRRPCAWPAAKRKSRPERGDRHGKETGGQSHRYRGPHHRAPMRPRIPRGARRPDQVGKYDALLSMACGVGIQFLAERYPDIPTFPGGRHHGTRPSIRPWAGTRSVAARAASACSESPAASAPSPCAPRAFSTVPAAEPIKESAKSARAAVRLVQNP